MFFIPKLCRRCNERKIYRADWDICRPCGILIEMEHTTDLNEMLGLAHEMLRHFGGGRLGIPLPRP